MPEYAPTPQAKKNPERRREDQAETDAATAQSDANIKATTEHAAEVSKEAADTIITIDELLAANIGYATLKIS